MVCPSSVLAHLAKLIVTIGCIKSLGDPYHAKGRTWPFCAYQFLLAHSILGILRFGSSRVNARDENKKDYSHLSYPILLSNSAKSIGANASIKYYLPYFRTIKSAICVRNTHFKFNCKKRKVLVLIVILIVLSATLFLALPLPGAPFTTSTTQVAKYFRSFYDWYGRIIDVLPLALFTTGILNGYGINGKIRLAMLSLGTVPVLFQFNISQIKNYQLLINITATLQLLAITFIGLQNNNYYVISLVVSYVFELFFIDEFCYYYDIPSTDLTQYSLCFIEIFMILTLKEL